MSTESLEAALLDDLSQRHDRFADERFCERLYRSLARTALRKPSVSEGHVVLSFKQAEDLINELRGRLGRADLTLAQTGGEGEVDPDVRTLLGEHGWSLSPATTSANDPGHDAADRQPPPDHHGDRAESGQWAREAHAEADAEQRRRRP